MSNVDEIIKYKQLLDNNVITKEEFEKKKAELLQAQEKNVNFQSNNVNVNQIHNAKNSAINMKKQKSSGLGVASLVLGILALCFSAIPFINFLAFIMSFLAFIFGIIGILKNNGRGMAIAGLILSIISLFVFINIIGSTINTINNGVNTINNSLSTEEENNEESKGQDIELSAGTYTVGEDIQPGKYDVKAISGMGNFFVYGNGSKYNLKANQAFSSTESQSYGIFGSTYNNLQLNKGDVVETNSNLVVKLISK